MADPTVSNPEIVPARPVRRGLNLRTPLNAGVAGLVTGALVVSVPLLLTLGRGKSVFGASSEALKAPAAIGDFKPEAQNPKTDSAALKQIAVSEPISAKNLSAAYGGASAVVRVYSDADLSNSVELEAVRARSPQPFLPYVDAQVLGMDKPDQQIVTFGQVHCLVNNIPVPLGQQEQPQSTTAVTCERTAAHLTVRLLLGGSDLPHSPQQAARLVDIAWSELQ